ncbi:YSC84-related protein [Pseudoalteromonas rubra]|uniref:Lipoprotein n=1 Tax=Pseudoalteromonas rubra TaxID=43658 RepID=A0A0F4QGE9_9GAMM|nr:YSC84-related protein [Pseudoalteromonas rubra]KJZ06793.1 lipoprotein [Pseudoalteromonas rubra]
MRTIPLLMSVVLSVFLSACASMGPGDAAQKRAEIQKMKRETLTKLYSKKPDVRAQLSNAPGYAVFSNANLNIIFVAAGTGYGVVEDNTSGKSTYMNMAEGGVGLGLGAKDYRIVMVFHTKAAMNQFVESGWTFGGNADAAARAADKGASIEGEVYYGDVTVYTLTESGLALQATIKGTKFWQDKELN